ncbi:hypothetical protein ROHU_031420 [Labeo rohita]|uniref:SH3 domain-containing protein n=1 Tax=Labeo rohita TaxID=84645 RepID=A0A498LMZ3_LABRO|nr:hypothetical protein ROHU_031420 [Labeo rohita]
MACSKLAVDKKRKVDFENHKCVALCDFTPEDDDELKLLKGETIEILKKSEGRWWKGKKNNQTGFFPTSYVKEIEPSKVLLSRAWENIVHYAASEKITIIAMIIVVILLIVIYIIDLFTENKEMPCHGEIWEWIWDKLTVVASFSFFILPSLQFTLLFITFRATGGGIFVSIIFPLSFFLTFACVTDINREKSCSNLLNIISWTIFMFIMTAVLLYFYITALKNEKDLSLISKKMLYVFGSVGVVLLNSVTLMTELILKVVNGERAVGDLRVVVFSSESLFVFSLLILLLFEPLRESEVRERDISKLKKIAK